MTNQSNNNNLYLNDPTFIKLNILFILSLKIIIEKMVKKKIIEILFHIITYQMSKKKKDFNVLIDGKSIFDLPVKNEEEAYEKIIEMSRSNENTTGTLLNFAYLKKTLTNCNWFE